MNRAYTPTDALEVLQTRTASDPAARGALQRVAQVLGVLPNPTGLTAGDAWAALAGLSEQSWTVGEATALRYLWLCVRGTTEPLIDVLPGTNVLVVGQREALPLIKRPASVGSSTALSVPELTQNFTVSERFATLALEPYRDWRVAWWREVLQNSIDAGSRTVRLDVRPTHVDLWGQPITKGLAWIVSVSDDGAGMSAMTVREHFLSLGGSGKGSGAGTTGGFGKAKELILLAWDQWHVHTVTKFGELTEVTGSHARYGTPRNERPTEAPPHGTTIRVLMRGENLEDMRTRTSLEHALEVIRRSYVPTVRVWVGDKQQSMEQGPAFGRPLKVWDNPQDTGRSTGRGTAEVRAEVQLTPSVSSPLPVLVRQNGLFMFELTTEAPAVNGQVTVECFGPARQFFTDNRDGFVWTFHHRAQSFVSELSIEGQYALRANTKEVKRAYLGRDLSDVRDERLAEIEAEMQQKLQKGQPPDPALLELFQRLIAAAGDMLDEDRVVKLDTGVDELREGLTLTTDTDADRIQQNLLWMPHVMVRAKYGTLPVPATYEPGPRMSQNARDLLRAWTAACRWTAVALGLGLGDVGVGFLFDWDADGLEHTAEYLSSFEAGNRYRWLLINPVHAQPTKLNAYGDVVGFKLAPRFRYPLRQLNDLLTICALAIHEVTHLQGFSAHDVRFSYAMTANMVLLPRILAVVSQALGMRVKSTVLKAASLTYQKRQPPPPPMMITRLFKDSDGQMLTLKLHLPEAANSPYRLEVQHGRGVELLSFDSPYEAARSVVPGLSSTEARQFWGLADQ